MNTHKELFKNPELIVNDFNLFRGMVNFIDRQGETHHFPKSVIMCSLSFCDLSGWEYQCGDVFPVYLDNKVHEIVIQEVKPSKVEHAPCLVFTEIKGQIKKAKEQ